MARDAGSRDALPLLAFALRRLYERHGQEGRLTLAEYEALGGLEGAIREEAQRVLTDARPSADDLEALHAAFVPAMVRINAEGGYARRRAVLLDLPTRAAPTLRRLVDARLLVTDRAADGREVIEVAHEALLRAWPQLGDWLAEDQDQPRLLESLQRAAEDWDKGGRRPELLLHRDSRLQDAEALPTNPRRRPPNPPRRSVLRKGALNPRSASARPLPGGLCRNPPRAPVQHARWIGESEKRNDFGVRAHQLYPFMPRLGGLRCIDCCSSR